MKQFHFSPEMKNQNCYDWHAYPTISGITLSPFNCVQNLSHVSRCFLLTNLMFWTFFSLDCPKLDAQVSTQSTHREKTRSHGSSDRPKFEWSQNF